LKKSSNFLNYSFFSNIVRDSFKKSYFITYNPMIFSNNYILQKGSLRELIPRVRLTRILELDSSKLKSLSDKLGVCTVTYQDEPNLSHLIAITYESSQHYDAARDLRKRFSPNLARVYVGSSSEYDPLEKQILGEEIIPKLRKLSGVRATNQSHYGSLNLAVERLAEAQEHFGLTEYESKLLGRIEDRFNYLEEQKELKKRRFYPKVR
jgi:hypothetical protein